MGGRKLVREREMLDDFCKDSTKLENSKIVWDDHSSNKCKHEPSYASEPVGDLIVCNFVAGGQICVKCGEGFEMSLKEFEEYNKNKCDSQGPNDPDNSEVFRAYKPLKKMLSGPIEKAVD